MLKQLFNEVLDFIIPPLCVSCNSPLNKPDLLLCAKCSAGLIRFDSEHPWRNYYMASGSIDNSFSLYRFAKDTPIQHLLHSLKYEKMKTIGHKLGKEIARHLPRDTKYDYSVPVPLHTAKLRERTYNQSEYLCRGIDVEIGSSSLPKLLIRKRFTVSQTNLNRVQRQENVRGAFEINMKYAGLINGKNIILADDVITTGATIIECSKVLKANGAKYVILCSAAYDAIDLN